jgi:hypothetical protein
LTAPGDTPSGRRWYESVWIMAGAGYVFPPLGFYLMWRYRAWPAWVKAGITVGGSAMALAGSYLSSTYVMPRVF